MPPGQRLVPQNKGNPRKSAGSSVNGTNPKKKVAEVVTPHKAYQPTAAEYAKAYPSTYVSPGTGLTALAPSSGVDSRGGSPFVDPTDNFTPASADLSKNPYGSAYDDLLNFIKQSAAARNPQFDDTKQLFQQQQAKANEQLSQGYLASRAQTDQSATALGVDPNVVSATRDLMMRKNQENSDQSLADNLAWLDKAKLLEGQQIGTNATAFAAEKAGKVAGWNDQEQSRVAAENLANLQAAVSAKLGRSSGGGGGSSGGSSSAGPLTETATETSSNLFGGMDKAFYDQLNKSNPEAAALYLNQHILYQGTPEMKATQKQINELAPSTKFTPKKDNAWNVVTNLSNAYGKQKAKLSSDKLANLQLILNGMLGYSGLQGTNKTAQKVVTTAKRQS